MKIFRKILFVLFFALQGTPISAAPQQHVICDSGCGGGSGTSAQGTRGAASNSWPFYLVNSDGSAPLMLTVPGTSATTSVVPVQGVTGGIAMPVSGTVAATKSGTWNIDSIISLPGITFAAPQHVIIDSGAVNITTDGTAATGVAQDTGGAGAIGWLSSIVKNVRLIATSLSGTLTVSFASAQHVVVDSITGAGALDAAQNSKTSLCTAGASSPCATVNANNEVLVSCASASHCIVDAARNSSGVVQIQQPDNFGVINSAGSTSAIVLCTPSGSNSCYIGNYALYIQSGTLPSFSFVYGTQVTTPCDTGQTVNGGPFGGTSGSVGEFFHDGDGEGSIIKAPSGKQECILFGGTTPQIAGHYSYMTF